MTVNYTKSLPRDNGGAAMQEYPAPASALARYASENSSASSVISFTHDTTAIEIGAIGNSAVMRWVATSDTQASVISAAANANFDHVIGSGTVRRFVVPRSTSPIQQPSLVGINRGEGLFQRVAIKSIGTASVLLTEY